MGPDHVVNVLFIIEGGWVVFVDGPECFEAVDEGLVRVGVQRRPRSLQPYQFGKERNTFQLHYLVRDVWHHCQSRDSLSGMAMQSSLRAEFGGACAGAGREPREAH